MSTSNSFSIYLLKEGKGATSALKSNHNLEKVAADNLPEESALYILDSAPKEPWWTSYFGVSKAVSEKLKQVTKSALLFLRVKNRWFVLAFGSGYHNLEEGSYEHDFGLKVTLNSVEPEKLKSTDTLELGSDRRQRTQLPFDSDLTFFDFDYNTTLLKSLTGKVKKKHHSWFRHATGSSSLRINSPVDADKLPKLCNELLNLYEKNDYKAIFPSIDNIVPVHDPDLINKLNNNLLEAFKSKNEKLNLTIPKIIDYEDSVSMEFSGCGRCGRLEDASIEDYYSYLEAREQNFNEIGIDEFKTKHKLNLLHGDEDEENKEPFSIMKCFVFDTQLPKNVEGAGTYHLTEGNWHKVEDDYLKKLKGFLDKLYHDLQLPEYNHADEGEYNQKAAEGKGYLCLDGKNICPEGQGQSKVEPCDIYAVQDESVIFYHVKKANSARELSHLFNQGTNAIELVKLEPEALEKLNSIIDGSKKLSKKTKTNSKRLLENRKYSVIFAIITHKDKKRNSLNLPLFSRISLMRSMKAMQRMSVKAHYGFIFSHKKI